MWGKVEDVFDGWDKQTHDLSSTEKLDILVGELHKIAGGGGGGGGDLGSSASKGKGKGKR